MNISLFSLTFCNTVNCNKKSISPPSSVLLFLFSPEGNFFSVCIRCFGREMRIIPPLIGANPYQLLSLLLVYGYANNLKEGETEKALLLTQKDLTSK